MFFYEVSLTKRAQKDLEKVPIAINLKLQQWVGAVCTRGLDEIKKVRSYRDKLLRGSREGQRCIRLSRAYRAFYVEKRSGQVHLISIIEVNKHDY